MNKHKHIARIIGEDTRTYQKGTIVCAKCGIALQFPKQTTDARKCQS